MYRFSPFLMPFMGCVNCVTYALSMWSLLLWYEIWWQIILKRKDESLASSLWKIICHQNWYQSISDYMDRAIVWGHYKCDSQKILFNPSIKRVNLPKHVQLASLHQPKNWYLLSLWVQHCKVCAYIQLSMLRVLELYKAESQRVLFKEIWRKWVRNMWCLLGKPKL